MAARWLKLWPSCLFSRQRQKESRSEGLSLCKDFPQSPSIVLLPSHWPELTLIPVPSHKEIGKVNIFSLVHCSPKQYQGSVHWEQGENRPQVSNQQPLPPPPYRYYVPRPWLSTGHNRLKATACTAERYRNGCETQCSWAWIQREKNQPLVPYSLASPGPKHGGKNVWLTPAAVSGGTQEMFQREICNRRIWFIMYINPWHVTWVIYVKQKVQVLI